MAGGLKWRINMFWKYFFMIMMAAWSILSIVALIKRVDADFGFMMAAIHTVGYAILDRLDA